MMSGISEPICLKDFELQAKQRLREEVTEYCSAASDEELTSNDNIKAYKRWRLRPRLLRGISDVDLSTTVLGQTVSMPICVAPTAYHRFVHPDGEIATARACAKSKTCMVLSMGSGFPLEDIAVAAPNGLRWLQFDILKNRQQVISLLHQAEKSGFQALVLTLDGNAITGNMLAVLKRGALSSAKLPKPLYTGERTFVPVDYDNVYEKNITWDIIPWIKSITKLPIVLKGILTAEDARLAVQHGADGIVVSNHGGIQLDGVLATIDALPEVISAVNGQIEVYVDGGVRLGTDVLKALALGARAVLIGRPVFWGLAYQGEEGVYKVLEILRKELRAAMMLSGCSSVSDIPASLVTRQCQCHNL